MVKPSFFTNKKLEYTSAYSSIASWSDVPAMTVSNAYMYKYHQYLNMDTMIMMW